MQLPAAIPEFLDAVQRRLRRVEGRRWTLVVLAVLLAAAAIVPLLTGWASIESARSLRNAGVALTAGAALAWFVLAIVVPRRRWRGHEDVARVVGRARPQVASDLLSTVQLARELSNGPVRFSSALALALAEDTGSRIAGLSVAELVPSTPVKRALRWLFVAIAVHLAVAFAATGLWTRGWKRLASPPDPQALAALATPVGEPLVGDLRLTLSYPGYMRRESLVLPVSSGDVVAPRGTRIDIETTALRPARAASLVFDPASGGPTPPAVPLSVDGLVLRGSFVVDRAVAFRFLLERDLGKPLVEAEPHRIELEPDHAPRVELIAPAEELDVSSRRRVELAYSAEDDHGLSELALVWRGPAGKVERRALPLGSVRSRATQGKYYWDLSDAALAPGARIAYWLEAKDNDSVAGPNVGTSRTFYLRVFSPRERHEDILARQQAFMEQMLAHLADRLERPDDEPSRHREMHGTAERLVLELGGLVTLLDQDTLAPRGLDAEMATMHQRMEKLVRGEAGLIEDLEQLMRRPQNLRAPPRVPLAEHDKKWVAELEKDILTLDDWLGRQQVEELLAISDEIKQHRERLKDLMAQYQRNPTPELRREIEREMRAIEQRMAELAQKSAKLSSEVADRFMNADALEADQEKDCFAEVRRLMDAGEMAAAQKQLERCSELAEQSMASLEESLQGLRGERFAEQEKAMSEMLGEIDDLAEAEQALAGEADEITRKYKERAQEQAKTQKQAEKDKAKRTLEQLKQEAASIPKEGLTPFSQEEHQALMKRIENVAEMLAEGDVPEALAMARQAREGLEAMAADLDDDVQDGQPWSDRTKEALEHTEIARPIADELLEDLEAAMPTPEQMMTPQERQRLGELRRRQKALQERGKKLAEKAQKRRGELPGQAGETIEKGLEEAGEMMERAGERLGAGDPVGGRDQAQKASERLGELGKQAQRSARPSMGQAASDEPVKIPGSDQYRPPQEFREDIIDAMKKDKAPRQYEDQVKRYYEELVK